MLAAQQMASLLPLKSELDSVSSFMCSLTNKNAVIIIRGTHVM